MLTRTRPLASVLFVAAVCLSCSLHAEPPVEPRQEPRVPKQAAYSNVVRLRILEITPVEKTSELHLLQLKVQRFYGKINQHSAELARKHETQEFTILFPSAPNAKINVGDLIDYRLDQYLPKSE